MDLYIENLNGFIIIKNLELYNIPITIRVSADKNGRYKTVDLMERIQNTCKNVLMPKSAAETCLADLSLTNGKKCYRGISQGVEGTYSNVAMEYLERDFVLYFA